MAASELGWNIWMSDHEGSSVLPALYNCLEDPDEFARLGALYGLSLALRLDPEPVVPRSTTDSLRSMMHSGPLSTRLQAIPICAFMGRAKDRFVEDLCLFANDEEAEIRCVAIGALWNVGIEDQAACDLILIRLEDTHDEVRAAAAAALSNRPSLATRAYPVLLKHFLSRDETLSVREAASRSLTKLIGSKPDTSRFLIQLISEPNFPSPEEWLLALSTTAVRIPATPLRNEIQRILKADLSNSEHRLAATIGLLEIAVGVRDDTLLAQVRRSSMETLEQIALQSPDTALFNWNNQRLFEALVQLQDWHPEEIEIRRLRSILDSFEIVDGHFLSPWVKQQSDALPGTPKNATEHR